ncbi:MAG: isoprenylcysteine carboxylmethyltransferase family protein [Endomicrobiales bacterium]|jgi:protein-S-isoprenylcysteine O-methyltransferase Ste14
MNIKTKILFAELIEIPIFAVLLFLPAGTFTWIAGWVFLTTFFCCCTILIFWLIKHNPEILNERMGGFKPDQKNWDKVIIVLIFVLFIAWLISMPLDAVRFHWSRVPVSLQVFGLLLMGYSFYLFFLVFRENSYLSSLVRVQKERGHTVVSTGLYRYVRHPMYATSLLFFVSTALLLGSWCGIMVGLLFAPLLGIRAVLEESLLRNQLKGYADYMTQVRYRFIPGIW